VLQLAEAAVGVCDLLWMIDGSIVEMREMTHLLNRFGQVVDVAGLDPTELHANVAPHEPSAIVTYLDAGMVAYAELAASLGLPFHSAATAAALIDKSRQRQVLAEAGLAMPPSGVIASDDALDGLSRFEAEVGWPAVLKPRSAQGSRFTFLAHDLGELVRLLEALGPRRPDMVLEGFIPDDPDRLAGPFAGYVSVETVVAGGVMSHLALTGRFPLAENFRETGFFIPAALDDAEQEAVLELATAAIAALGISIGCLHTEIKFTPEGPRIIEVNGRVGGGVHEMLERAAGLHLLELTLRVALGEAIRIDGPVATKQVGYRFFLQPPAISATVATLRGVDAVSEHPTVDTVSVHRGPGANLDWRDGTRTHLIAVVGAAKDYDELQAVDRLLRQEVSATYADVRH
jgi:biotin carboxylase